MTDAPAAAPAAPAAAPGGSPTHVTMQPTTGYQGATPPENPTPAPAANAAGATPPAIPPAVEPPPAPGNQPPVENKPADSAQNPAKEQPPIEFKLPDEYKDKPWAAKVKSLDDVYKQIDTLDALKGKKTVVPNLKEASPEEREAFYSQLRGKDAAEYPLPKDTTVPIPEDTQPAIAKMFMDNGISPVQAEGFIKEYLGLREKQIAEYYNPEGFTKSMETAFGNDWKSVTGQIKNTISGMMNADDQKALDNLPNHILGVVYRTLGNTIKTAEEYVKRYNPNESFAHLKAPGGQVGATDLGSAREGWRNEIAALSKRPHTDMERQVIIDKIANSYKNDPRLTQ